MVVNRFPYEVTVKKIYGFRSPRIVWCKEFVGPQSINWDLNLIDAKLDVSIFCFANTQHAFMFTLMFGNEDVT